MSGLAIERSADAAKTYINTKGGATTFNNHNAAANAGLPYRWYMNESHKMSLTTTGLGIGVTAPECGFDLHKAAVGGLRLNIHNSAVEDASDASITFETQGQMDWGMGIDRSDSGKFKIGHHATVGSNTALTLNTNGDVDISNRLGVGGAHSDSYGLNVHGTSYFGDNVSSVDDDKSAQFGRASIGHVGHDDYAGFSHRDQASANNYAILQSSAGATFLNSKDGQTIYFRQNNANVGAIVGTNWGIGTIVPGTYKLYVSGTSYFSQAAEFDGGIKDKDGNLGTDGQLLKSTGSDVDWVTLGWEDLPNISTLDALP